MTLNVVVLPAPFGPISPVIVPSSTARLDVVRPPCGRRSGRETSRGLEERHAHLPPVRGPSSASIERSADSAAVTGPSDAHQLGHQTAARRSPRRPRWPASRSSTCSSPRPRRSRTFSAISADGAVGVGGQADAGQAGQQDHDVARGRVRRRRSAGASTSSERRRTAAPDTAVMPPTTASSTSGQAGQGALRAVRTARCRPCRRHPASSAPPRPAMAADRANTCELGAGEVEAERGAGGRAVLHGLEPAAERAPAQDGDEQSRAARTPRPSATRLARSLRSRRDPERAVASPATASPSLEDGSIAGEHRLLAGTGRTPWWPGRGRGPSAAGRAGRRARRRRPRTPRRRRGRPGCRRAPTSHITTAPMPAKASWASEIWPP